MVVIGSVNGYSKCYTKAQAMKERENDGFHTQGRNSSSDESYL
jgi:hypothetical protein